MALEARIGGPCEEFSLTSELQPALPADTTLSPSLYPQALSGVCVLG